LDGGKVIRDYLYIDDVVSALLLSGVEMKKAGGNYYVLGSGEGTTLKEMAEFISKEVTKKTTKEIRIKEKPFPKEPSPIERRNFIADITKIKKDIGWQPQVFLKEGISKTIDYFLEQGAKI